MKRMVEMTCALSAIVTLCAEAHAQSGFDDVLVQPAELSAPGRGSVAGTLAGLSFAGSDMARGAHSIGLPIDLPSERGAALAGIIPSYSPENGMSEWGMGWSAENVIRRFRTVGDIDYSDVDEFSTPWGKLVSAGDHYRVAGLRSLVVARRVGEAWEVTDASGSVYRFTEKLRAPNGTRGLCDASNPCIYAWYLTEVESAVGATTTIEYFDLVSSVRRYVKEVRWGSQGRPDFHRLTLRYSALPTPSIDYRPGYPLELGFHVTGVDVDGVDVDSGELVPRWSYELGYVASPTGPAHYLVSVTKGHLGGTSPPCNLDDGCVSEPATTYAYDLDTRELGAARSFEAVPELSAYIGQKGEFALGATRASFTDFGLDGIPEFEHRENYTLFRFENGSWQGTPIARDPNAEDRCAPATHDEPRHLAHVLPGSLDPHVVATTDDGGGGTEVMLCERNGLVIAAAEIPDEDFRLGQAHLRTRLVDLSRDHRPEIIRIGNDRYDVIELVIDGGLPATLSLVNRGGGPLKDADGNPPAWGGDPKAAWVRDVNGDGLADIVGRTQADLTVWYGLGGFTFAERGERLRIVDENGGALSAASYAVSFVDANADGLSDVVLTGVTASEARLCFNRGDGRLVQHDVPGLRGLDGNIANPIVVDLRRNGNTELVYTHGSQVWSFALDGPSTGQLVEANDGKGTVVRFDLGRVDEFEGAGHRPSVLRELLVATVGHEPTTQRYDYDDAVLHSRARFLLGFGRVERRAPPMIADGSGELVFGLLETTFFDHEDDTSVVIETRATDARTPGIEKFQRTFYEDYVFDGVAGKRMVASSSGQRPPSQLEPGVVAPGEVATIDAVGPYHPEKRFCPLVTRHDGPGGTLTRTVDVVELAELPEGTPHCLHGREVLEGGAGSDGFVFHQDVSRNRLGQVTQVVLGEGRGEGGGETQVLQKVAYDALHRAVRIESPGKGEVVIEYDAFQRIARITAPDGVEKSPVLDPRTDAILELSEIRDSAVLTNYFRYDQFERLERQWSSFGGTSENEPLARHEYRFGVAPTLDIDGNVASEGAPGIVETFGWSEFDPGQPPAYTHSAALVDGGGGALASATRLPQGWVIGDLVRHFDNTARTEALRQPATLDGALEPEELALSTVRANALIVGESIGAGFGHATSATATVDSDLDGDPIKTKTTTSIELDFLTQTIVSSVSVESDEGVFTSSSRSDADGRLLSHTDAAGNTFEFRYDALGRIVKIVSPGPDAPSHTIGYDGLGRPAIVMRSDVGTFRYRYEPVTGNLSQRAFYVLLSVFEPERRTRFFYDAIGRIRRVVHEQPAAGAETSFVHTYATSGADRGRLLSTVESEIERHFTYNIDGSIATSLTVFPGFRQVEVAHTYDAAGREVAKTRIVSDAAGNPLADIPEVTSSHRYDGFGRLAETSLSNGIRLAMSYDDIGRLGECVITGPEAGAEQGREEVARLIYGYEPLTGALRSTDHIAPAWNGRVEQYRSDRGLVARESYFFGSDVVDRDYTYDSRGFLIESIDTDHAAGLSLPDAAHAYDSRGMITSSTDGHGTRELDFVDRVLMIGEGEDPSRIEYRRDKQGRIEYRYTKKDGESHYTYGPDGHLSRAVTSSGAHTYAYDDAGQRVLKRTDGAVVAAYLGGSYLDDSAFIEPVRIGGRLIGVLENAEFHFLATDPRGTRLNNTDGTPNLATAYGLRSERPDLDVALDYVEGAYDADLGTVRFGVRDYDPYLGQFTTPDPLFLEDLEACVESPVECNLYGYALNNPVSFVDPSGMNGELDAKLGMPDGELEDYSVGEYKVFTISGSTSHRNSSTSSIFQLAFKKFVADKEFVFNDEFTNAVMTFLQGHAPHHLADVHDFITYYGPVSFDLVFMGKVSSWRPGNLSSQGNSSRGVGNTTMIGSDFGPKAEVLFSDSTQVGSSQGFTVRGLVVNLTGHYYVRRRWISPEGEVVTDDYLIESPVAAEVTTVVNEYVSVGPSVTKRNAAKVGRFFSALKRVVKNHVAKERWGPIVPD